MLKYSKFKKALFGVPGFIFFELEDGMGADIDIENKAIELRPLADLRVYKEEKDLFSDILKNKK